MRLFLILFISMLLFALPAQACEFCTIAYMGQKKQSVDESKHRWAAKVFYENQDWDEITASEAHQLHHQGHHFHDKQDEQVVHTILAFKVNERFSLETSIPYVTRHFIEIDSHAHLGENQTSSGLGDVTVTADYRFIQDQQKSAGMIAGLKTPTGKTSEHTSFGALMEPEMQPGTGSLDYIAGLTGSLHHGPWDFSSSAIYVHKTEGNQDFRFGDTLSVTMFFGKNFDCDNGVHFSPGIMINNQLEKKQNNTAGNIKDSGGYTMLVGPQLDLSYKSMTLSLGHLSPVVQELGGVHQKLNDIWTSSLAVKF